MTTEELDERLAAHETSIRALVSSFLEPTAKATEIMAASEERAKQEREAYDKRAAEHDAAARAQHARAEMALDLQRRNVEAWERIASALERLAMFNFSSAFGAAPFGGYGGYDNCTCVVPQPSTDGTRCGLCGKRRK